MVTTTPDDLIPAREAATLVDRSLSTIRSWVREGRLPGYRGASDHPETAPLLVSRAELLHYAGAAALAMSPGRPARLPPPGAPPPASPAPPPGAPPEIMAALLEAHRGQVAALEARIATTEARLDEWRARATRAEAVLEELTAARRAELTPAARPWWARLLQVNRPPPG